MELFGLVFGELEQYGLEVSEITADRGGVERVALGEQFDGTCRRKDLGCQHAVQRVFGRW